MIHFTPSLLINQQSFKHVRGEEKGSKQVELNWAKD